MLKIFFNFFCTFQDMARRGNHYKKLLRGDNSINIKGRIMVIVHCPSPYCHLSINQVSFKSQQWFLSYLPDKIPDGQTKLWLYASPSGEHKKYCVHKHNLLTLSLFLILFWNVISEKYFAVFFPVGNLHF